MKMQLASHGKGSAPPILHGGKKMKKGVFVCVCVFMKFLFTCTWVGGGGREKTYRIEPPDPHHTLKKIGITKIAKV